MTDDGVTSHLHLRPSSSLEPDHSPFTNKISVRWSDAIRGNLRLLSRFVNLLGVVFYFLFFEPKNTPQSVMVAWFLFTFVYDIFVLYYAIPLSVLWKQHCHSFSCVSVGGTCFSAFRYAVSKSEIEPNSGFPYVDLTLKLKPHDRNFVLQERFRSFIFLVSDVGGAVLYFVPTFLFLFRWQFEYGWFLFSCISFFVWVISFLWERYEFLHPHLLFCQKRQHISQKEGRETWCLIRRSNETEMKHELTIQKKQKQEQEQEGDQEPEQKQEKNNANGEDFESEFENKKEEEDQSDMEESQAEMHRSSVTEMSNWSNQYSSMTVSCPFTFSAYNSKDMRSIMLCATLLPKNLPRPAKGKVTREVKKYVKWSELNLVRSDLLDIWSANEQTAFRRSIRENRKEWSKLVQRKLCQTFPFSFESQTIGFSIFVLITWLIFSSALTQCGVIESYHLAASTILTFTNACQLFGQFCVDRESKGFQFHQTGLMSKSNKSSSIAQTFVFLLFLLACSDFVLLCVVDSPGNSQHLWLPKVAVFTGSFSNVVAIALQLALADLLCVQTKKKPTLTLPDDIL